MEKHKCVIIHPDIVEEAKTIIRTLLKEPWGTPMGFAGECQYCGKPYPQWNSNAEEHYDNCLYLRAKRFMEHESQ